MHTFPFVGNEVRAVEGKHMMVPTMANHERGNLYGYLSTASIPDSEYERYSKPLLSGATP